MAELAGFVPGRAAQAEAFNDDFDLPLVAEHLVATTQGGERHLG